MPNDVIAKRNIKNSKYSADGSKKAHAVEHAVG